MCYNYHLHLLEQKQCQLPFNKWNFIVLTQISDTL